jgi:PKHD-type hydroxylase
VPNYAPQIVAGALPPGVCDQTIDVAKDIGFEASPVYSERGVGSIDDPNHRRSESVWLQPEHYPDLYKRAIALFNQINNANFRFSLTGMVPIQILRYRSGCFFSEHFDIGVADAARRKISLIVQLSDSDDYEGGEFIVGGRLTMPKRRGTACVFPSWFQHRVDEVRSGIRYSLAAWAEGSYFL